MPNAARTTSPSAMPGSTGRNAKIAATRLMTTAWTASGTISLSARPTMRAERATGVTSIRSWEPDCSSKSRFEPAIAVPKRVLMTMMPGTNHWKDSASGRPVVPLSSGPKKARKTSGWSREKMTLNGSRSTGHSSRTSPLRVSRSTWVGVGAVMASPSECRLGSRGGGGGVLGDGLLLAQAAAGEREEDVVEGGLVELGREHPVPARGQGAEQPG